MADQEKQELEDLEPQKDAKGGAASADAIYMKNNALDAASLDAGQSQDRSSLDRGTKNLD